MVSFRVISSIIIVILTIITSILTIFLVRKPAYETIDKFTQIKNDYKIIEEKITGNHAKI